MIFVTVGTQLAFDRLISAVDGWCASNPTTKVFAQVGPTDLKVLNMAHEGFLSPDKANKLFVEATMIVAHAGMGSVLTALKHRKPIVIMPRKASLGEHRNEHQLATAKWLSTRAGINVAWDESELIAFLDNQAAFESAGEISDYASPELIENLKQFIVD